ncbi:MAG: hypothetical protein ACE5GQ_01455, partial [Nitrospinales bacterium]
MFWNNKNHPKIFAGWPKTTCDRKKREVVIAASYLTPKGAEWRDTLSVLIALATIICGFIYAERLALGWTHMIAAGMALTVNYYFILPFILNIRVWIVFSEDRIRIRTLFSFWSDYERGRDGYGFKHIPHKKGQEEPVAIGKNATSYFLNSYQIYMNHYQGFIMLPGIYGWEKSVQLYNRIMGVEMWIHNLMPRIWGSRVDVDQNKSLTPPNEGWFKTLMRKISGGAFFLYGFMTCASALMVLFLVGMIALFLLFGASVQESVFQFLTTLPEWGQALEILVCGAICVYAGRKEARRLNKKFFDKEEDSSEKDVMDAEFSDSEETREAPKGIKSFLIKAASFVLAPILTFILGGLVFHFL